VSDFNILKNIDDENRKYVIIKEIKRINDNDVKKRIVIWRDVKNLDPQKDFEFIKKEIPDIYNYKEIHINANQHLIQNAILIDKQFKKLMNGD
jgi:hypothetical protein